MSDRERSFTPNDRDMNDHTSKNHRDRSYSRSPRRHKETERRTIRYRSRSRSDGRGRSHSRSPMSSRRRHQGTRENPKPSACLGVFGLSVYTTETELRHIFQRYGKIDRVQVVIDAKTSRSRGFAFVYFANVEDSKVAKEQCNGLKISNKSIRVDYSITKRAHTPTPGIYMGKPTSDRYDRRRDRERDDYSYRSRGDRDRYYSRRSPSPYYSGSSRSRRYDRSRSRSYSSRRY